MCNKIAKIKRALVPTSNRISKQTVCTKQNVMNEQTELDEDSEDDAACICCISLYLRSKTRDTMSKVTKVGSYRMSGCPEKLKNVYVPVVLMIFIIL